MACFINIYLACFYLYYSLKDPLPCLFFLAGRSFRGILKRESLSNSNKEDKLYIVYAEFAYFACQGQRAKARSILSNLIETTVDIITFLVDESDERITREYECKFLTYL